MLANRPPSQLLTGALGSTRLDRLRAAITCTLGYEPKTPNDFDHLQADIERRIREHIGVSTLKRIWGYVEGWRRPRVSTLDVLARYIGHADFAAWVRNTEEGADAESEYAPDVVLHVDSLVPGTVVEVSWNPDRRVLLRYTGNLRFDIIFNENSKLHTGHVLTCVYLKEGSPLYADILDPATGQSRSYLAGKLHGIRYHMHHFDIPADTSAPI